MTPSLRAGITRTNITPPVGISPGNWGAQTHARAAGVDLDLLGTALVFAQGDTQVAMGKIQTPAGKHAVAGQEILLVNDERFDLRQISQRADCVADVCQRQIRATRT